MTGMRIGSLCSGYGGLDAAVVSVFGGELAWVSDNDPSCQAILAERAPGVRNLGDFREVDWAAVEPVDLLCAGFPCQPVSAAGRGKGIHDDRWLWDDITEAVSRMGARPRLLVFENVPGLLSANSGGAIARVASSLAALGYEYCWRSVRASDAGAPHRRARWFCLAWLAADSLRVPGDWRPDVTLGEPQGREAAWRASQGPAADPERGGVQRWGIPGLLGGQEPETAGDLDKGQVPERQWQQRHGNSPADRGPAAPPDPAGIGPGEPDSQADTIPGNPGPREVPVRGGSAAAESTRDRRHEGRPEPAGAQGRQDAAVRGDGPPADSPGPGRETRAGDSERTQPPSGDGQPPRPPGPVTDWREYGPAIRRWESVTGRPAPAPTEPGKTGQRLSPAFVEWMMGLPEGWVTAVPGLTRNQRLKALGNGVVPQQAALALRSLLNDIDTRKDSHARHDTHPGSGTR